MAMYAVRLACLRRWLHGWLA